MCICFPLLAHHKVLVTAVQNGNLELEKSFGEETASTTIAECDIANIVVDILCATALCNDANANESAHARFAVPSRTLLLKTIKGDKDWTVKDALYALCFACALNDLDTECAAAPAENAKRTWIVEEVGAARLATSLKLIAPPVVKRAATEFLSARVRLMSDSSVPLDASEEVRKLSGALCGCTCTTGSTGTCPARDTLSQHTASVTSRVLANRPIGDDVAEVRSWYEWHGRGSDLDSAGVDDDVYSDLDKLGKSFASSYPVVCPGRTVGGIVSALNELTKVTAIFPSGVDPSAAPVLVVHMPREQWQNALRDEFEATVERARGCVFSNLAPGTVTLAFVGHHQDQRISAESLLDNLKNGAHPSLQLWLGGKTACSLAYLEWDALPHFPSNKSLDASPRTKTNTEDWTNAGACMLMAHLGVNPGGTAGTSVTVVLHAPLQHAEQGAAAFKAIGDGAASAATAESTPALTGANYMSLCESKETWNASEFVKQVSLSQDRIATLFGGCVVEQYIPTATFQLAHALALFVFWSRSAEDGNTSGGAAVVPEEDLVWIREITKAGSFVEASKIDVHLGQHARKRTSAIKKILAKAGVTDATIIVAVRALLASHQVAAALDDLTRSIKGGEGDLEKTKAAATIIVRFVVDLVSSAVLRGNNVDRLPASLAAVSNERLSAASEVFKVLAKRRENAEKLRKARDAARGLALSTAASANDAKAAAAAATAAIDPDPVEANGGANPGQFDTAILLKELKADLDVDGEFTADRMTGLIVVLQNVLSAVLSIIQGCIEKTTTTAIPNRYEVTEEPRRKKIASLLILLLGTVGYAKACKMTPGECYDTAVLEALRGWKGCETLLSNFIDQIEHVSVGGAALALESVGRPKELQKLLFNPAGIVLQFIYYHDLNAGDAAIPLLSSSSVRGSELYASATKQAGDPTGVWSPAAGSSIITPLASIRLALTGKSSAVIDQMKQICLQVALHATKTPPSSSGGAGACSGKVETNVWTVNGTVRGGSSTSCIYCRSETIPPTSAVFKAVLGAMEEHSECKKSSDKERQTTAATLSEEVVMCGVCGGVAHRFCTSDAIGLLSRLRSNDTPDFEEGDARVCFNCNTPAHGLPKLEVRLLWDSQHRTTYQALPLRKILMDEDAEDAVAGDDDIVTSSLTVYRTVKFQDLVIPANAPWTLTKAISGNWSATSQPDTFFFTGDDEENTGENGATGSTKGNKRSCAEGSSNDTLLALAKAMAKRPKVQKAPSVSLSGNDMAHVVASTVACLRDNLETVIVNPENMTHDTGQLKSLLQDALSAIELQEGTDPSALVKATGKKASPAKKTRAPQRKAKASDAADEAVTKAAAAEAVALNAGIAAASAFEVGEEVSGNTGATQTSTPLLKKRGSATFSQDSSADERDNYTDAGAGAANSNTEMLSASKKKKASSKDDTARATKKLKKQTQKKPATTTAADDDASDNDSDGKAAAAAAAAEGRSASKSKQKKNAKAGATSRKSKKKPAASVNEALGPGASPEEYIAAAPQSNPAVKKSKK